MAVLDFFMYFILLILVVIGIGLGLYVSNAITSLVNYQTNDVLVSINYMTIASLAILVLVAILLFVNLIAMAFFQRAAVSTLGYGFPFWIAIVSLILLFVSFVLYV